jgi:putative hydrolase of the HAD superfamily
VTEKPTAELRALVVDYGGVLTTPLRDTMDGWTRSEGLDREVVARTMREWIVRSYNDPGGIVHGLETGRIPAAEFERALAAELTQASGRQVVPDGLLDRMFSGFQEEIGMTGALVRARAGGFLTALLSNSWGNEYPRERWDELFDVTIVSGEVGLRKPDPAIYHLVAERLGVPTSACVFVDDLAPNVKAAADVGMVGVQHTDVETTLGELEILLGLPLR